MVSKSNVIETNTKCSCGNGDENNPQKNYFENKCPNCGKEGTLQLETISNVEVESDTDETETTNTESINNNSSLNKIVCKNCGSEYCGQDGYDLHGGTRSSLTTVNPNDVSEDEDEESSSTEEGETTYMSGWEGLCDLLKPLDGQAMMVQRGDYVVIKKIEMPQTAKLWAYEGINVVDDSVSITDYTPEIYNTFIVKWGESFENELEFVINNHKKLFGERKVVIEAKKIQVVGDDESEEESTDENSEGGGIFDWIFGSSDNENIDNKNVDNGDETNQNGEDEEIPETEEVPITDKEEAIQFGLTEVGKAKRENGHSIELKVIGNQRWQMGEWCHVKLPSFGEDSYMFISKCGFESSPDNEYINTLTLVDYPPSLGKPKKEETEQNTEEEEKSGTSDIANSDNDTNESNEESNQENNDENN